MLSGFPVVPQLRSGPPREQGVHQTESRSHHDHITILDTDRSGLHQWSGRIISFGFMVFTYITGITRFLSAFGALPQAAHDMQRRTQDLNGPVPDY
eukprot:3330119-Rhodomonas_salina.5